MLDYEPSSGVFRWKRRAEFADNWNTKHVGKVAGAENHGYWRIKINGKRYSAHRLAWLIVTGDWPIEYIDHKDGDKGNNKFENLRAASHSQNHANVPVRPHNKLGIKGVCFRPRRGLYQAQLKKDGKAHSLGFFATAEEAHAAYVEAANRMHGEFARAA